MHGPESGKTFSEPDLFYITGEDIAEHHRLGVAFLAKQKKRGLYGKVIAGADVAPDVDEQIEALLASEWFRPHAGKMKFLAVSPGFFDYGSKHGFHLGIAVFSVQCQAGQIF
jgi:hypothetical protein